jgi:pimeloyl-ACP methyl ester carboxylesterase
MIHGWLSYRGVWRQTMPTLAESYHCIGIDLLGFGESDKPAEADYSIEAQARRVLQLTDALGYDRFGLMGHSMGGQIALYIAANLAPERVDKLVNVAGVVSARLMPAIEQLNYPFIALAKNFPQLYSLWHYFFRYDWFVREVFKSWFYCWEAVPFESWAVDRSMAIRPEVYMSAYQAGRAIRRMDLNPYLAKIMAPTLTIFGQQDAVVPVRDGHLAQARIPDSRLVLIDECGHFPMYEKTAQYLAALRRFL